MAYISLDINSKNSGVYASEFNLSLTSSEGDIYYTTDCSDPTIESTKYTGTIRITDRSGEENIHANRDNMWGGVGSNYLPKNPVDKCMVIKAIVLDNNGYTSPITTKSFWVDQNHYFEQGIGVASLSTDPDSLFGYENGIHVLGKSYDELKDTLGRDPTRVEMFYNEGANFYKKGYENERIGDLSYFNHKGNLKCEQKVGIRIHGNYTRQFIKKSFNLYSRYSYDTNNTFDYKFNDKKSEKIILKNGGNHQKFQLEHLINLEIVKETNMKFDAQDFSATYLFLNGEFWGVYFIMDRFYDRYIEEKYDVEDHIMIKELSIEEGFKTDSPLITDFHNLKKLDFTNETNFEKFLNLVDIDSFIDYTLFYSYVYISDWASNDNFQMWTSRNQSEKPFEDKKLRFMMNDSDSSFSGPETDVFKTKLETIEILNALVKNSYFKEYFSQKAYAFIEKMSADSITNIAMGIYNTYVDFVNEDCQRHVGTNHSVTYYNRMVSFLTDRSAYYTAHIDLLLS